MTAVSTEVDDTWSGAPGHTDLGEIRVADKVVQKIAARAAAEHPDAGAAARRVLGREVPGGGSSLDRLPRTTVEVDGSKAFVRVSLGVRWPVSVARTTQEVRSHVRDRVHELTGLDVDEVHITVSDLVTDIAAPPRVR